jgi:hypothetical protein
MSTAPTPLAPVDLFDLAAGLRALTFEIVEHADDPRPSPHLHGLAVAAENLAAQLADATWELVESAPTRERLEPEPIRFPEQSNEEHAALIRESIARLQTTLRDVQSADQDRAPLAGGIE